MSQAVNEMEIRHNVVCCRSACLPQFCRRQCCEMLLLLFIFSKNMFYFEQCTAILNNTFGSVCLRVNCPRSIMG